MGEFLLTWLAVIGCMAWAIAVVALVCFGIIQWADHDNVQRLVVAFICAALLLSGGLALFITQIGTPTKEYRHAASP